MNELMDRYHRAQEEFDETVAALPADAWDRPSACRDWTARDVLAHVIWGQELIRAWATGQDVPSTVGAPGSKHPGARVGDDPVGAWRAAREAAEAAITPEGLNRVVNSRGFGEIRVEDFIAGPLFMDTLTHAWDIGRAAHREVRLDPALLAAAFEWSRGNLMRIPGALGPELTPPEGADQQTRYLAYLGRKAW